VSKSTREILEVKNFGKRSLAELEKILRKLGLQLGMDLAERSRDLGVRLEDD
jgi:DNA-directed RNA polymerase alpha subunit